MEPIARWRRPATTVALAGLSVALLQRLTGFVAAISEPGSDAAGFGSLAAGNDLLLLSLLAGLLVASCFLAPAVPARRGLALWGAVAVLVVALSGLVAVVVGVSALRPAAALSVALPRLAALLVPALVGWGLLVLRGRRSSGGPTADAAPAVEPAPEPAPDPEQQPTWASDTAAGAVWQTAGDAARGAPASGWGATATPGWAPRGGPAARELEQAAGPPVPPEGGRPGAGPGRPGAWSGHPDDRGDSPSS